MMEAIILAGGLGTRLGEIVKDRPKPMVEINGQPFLVYLLDSLAVSGVKKVIMAVGYKGEVIINYFGFSFKGMKIEYSIEENPLGTGGALKKAMSLCKNNWVLALNGDSYNCIDFIKMFNAHMEWGGHITMAITQLDHFDRYGAVEIQEGMVKSFTEKGYREKGYINRGVYVIDRKFLESKEEEKFSFEKDILEKQAGMINVFFSEGCFIDIGIPADYKRANLFFRKEGYKIGHET